MGTDGIVLGPFFSVSAEKGPECSLRACVVELYLTCACRVHGFRAAAHRQVLWQELERHYIRTQHLIWRVHHGELSTSSQSWFETIHVWVPIILGIHHARAHEDCGVSLSRPMCERNPRPQPAVL